jgi:hypothetical protein
MLKKLGLVIAIFLSLCSLMPVHAAEVPHNSSLLSEWNSETHLLLAQCMIAEADESEKDHLAIAYASRNWWLFRKDKYPELRYRDILRSYCSVHKLSNKSLSARQRWIRQLLLPKKGEDGNPILSKPIDFPASASWERKSRIWIETLQRAWNWNQGKYVDPCDGEAMHWGAPQDPTNRWYLSTDEPSHRLQRLECSDYLENDYYRYKTKKELEGESQLSVNKPQGSILLTNVD